MKYLSMFIISTFFLISCIAIMSTGTQTAYAQSMETESVQEDSTPTIDEQEDSVPSADGQEYSVPTIDEQEEPWLIQVDMYNQVVTIYAKDDEGLYTTVIKEFPCSTGVEAYLTESKTLYMVKELRKIDEQRNVYFQRRNWGKWGWVQYITNIHGESLFHSILYGDEYFNDYIHDSYTDLTFPASHGCVRMPTEGVKWIYDNIKEDTVLSITKTQPNPELSQSLQPMPPKRGNVVATLPPDFEPRVTSEPHVEWQRINWDPEGYLDDWEVNSNTP